PPFTSITFGYQPRPDVRHARFQTATVPLKYRLTSIVTSLGSYTLEYLPDDLLFPSRLWNIYYRPGGVCLDPLSDGSCRPSLTFDWDQAPYSWEEAPSFAPPISLTPVPTPNARSPVPSGGQFFDLDGDGRMDLVQSKDGSPAKVWLNDGGT